MHTITAIILGLTLRVAGASAPTPDSNVDWDYHAARFRPLFDGFARERESVPVTSFAMEDIVRDPRRLFRVKTRPSLFRPGSTASVTFREDRHGLVFDETRLSDRDLAEYLYLSVLVLVMDRRPVPQRVLVSLPWHDPERRAIFDAAPGNWRAGWSTADFARALAHFGFVLSAVDERGRALFRLDPCSMLLLGHD